MNAWTDGLSEKFGAAKLLKLNTIGKTRWWAKAGAIQKIFGEFGDAEAANKSLYVDVLTCFFEFASNPQFNVTARDEARTLMDKMRKFETILTAATFNRIFTNTTPLSEYLQTSRLDILQAWRMVESAIEQLEGISRDFPTVLEVATQFAKTPTTAWLLLIADVEVEESLPPNEFEEGSCLSVKQITATTAPTTLMGTMKRKYTTL